MRLLQMRNKRSCTEICRSDCICSVKFFGQWTLHTKAGPVNSCRSKTNLIIKTNFTSICVKMQQGRRGTCTKSESLARKGRCCSSTKNQDSTSVRETCRDSVELIQSNVKVCTMRWWYSWPGRRTASIQPSLPCLLMQSGYACVSRHTLLCLR